MQLTQFTDYSLRLLIYLALSEDGATISEVAERFGIARNHLTRIVHDLGRKGWIITTRGRGGGIRLAHEPKAINIGKVVRSVEPNFHIVECFDREHNACVITGACVLKRVLADAMSAFFAELDQYTLADVIANQKPLRASLGMVAIPTLKFSPPVTPAKAGV